MAILHTSDATFEKDVIEAGKPVMVDFWAPWCGPCRMIGPALEELSGEIDENEALIAKLNTDENPGVSAALNIRSIPTVAVFVGNKVVDVLVGARPKQDYENALRDAVEKYANEPKLAVAN